VRRCATATGSLSRYHELLPSSGPDVQLSLGEVVTPLLRMDRYAAEVGVDELRVEDAGRLAHLFARSPGDRLSARISAAVGFGSPITG
jgi:hypothetical protein